MTGRTCSRCERPAAARGLCFAHHQRFMQENPGAKLTAINEKAVLAAMPGTRAELMAATELTVRTVKRAIQALRDADK